MRVARITVEIDADGRAVTTGRDEVQPTPAGDEGTQPPADVMAAAAAIGAQNAGAAPAISGQHQGAPEPFMEVAQQPAGGEAGSTSAGGAPGSEGGASDMTETGGGGEASGA